jgi:hypothetical protein
MVADEFGVQRLGADHHVGRFGLGRACQKCGAGNEGEKVQFVHAATYSAASRIFRQRWLSGADVGGD